MSYRLLTDEERLMRRRMARIRQIELAAQERARKCGALVIEDVKREVLISRDGDCCYLCGQWMPWRDCCFDHVLPLSKGGDHTYANVRLTHRSCNSRKGDRLLCELDLGEF